MNTTNITYNRAWDRIAMLFPEDEIAGRLWIDLSDGKPPRTRSAFLQFVNDLLEVVKIGERNGWLSLHVNGRGDISYLVHNPQNTATAPG